MAEVGEKIRYGMMGRQAKQIVEIPYWTGISHAVPQKYVGVGVCVNVSGFVTEQKAKWNLNIYIYIDEY